MRLFPPAEGVGNDDQRDVREIPGILGRRLRIVRTGEFAADDVLLEGAVSEMQVAFPGQPAASTILSCSAPRRSAESQNMDRPDKNRS